ncbi:uncharacterized protein LOC114298624 isoform X1 [Camellia sinensis]|uniref:uncharacterized protein LOC114298624 isoform X1 n=1 Tax=Camellia sinensis TaxID=4442 RepID=UPI001036012B|nr:uncharacterized protein LOC114298624 isoform X1 [Camellia sinensis]
MDLHKPCLLDCRIDGETLKSIASHWPPQRWQEYEPLFTYCRDNGVRIVACGTLLEVSRTVQAEVCFFWAKFISICTSKSSGGIHNVPGHLVSDVKWRSHWYASSGYWCKPCYIWVKGDWATSKNFKEDTNEKSCCYLT